MKFLCFILNSLFSYRKEIESTLHCIYTHWNDTERNSLAAAYVFLYELGVYEDFFFVFINEIISKFTREKYSKTVFYKRARF